MRGPRFETFERNDGLVDWRLKAGNAEVVATSHGQGFRDRTDAERSIRSVVYAIADVLEVKAGVALGAESIAEFPIVHLEAGELGFTPSGEETDSGDEGSENGEAEAGDEQGDDAGEAQELTSSDVGELGDVLGGEDRGDRIDG